MGSKNTQEYIRNYMRIYRLARECRGHDHTAMRRFEPKPGIPPRRDIGPEPSTPDEIRGAKESLEAAHRLRAIGVKY
jgi:hypothetical protein